MSTSIEEPTKRNKITLFFIFVLGLLLTPVSILMTANALSTWTNGIPWSSLLMLPLTFSLACLGIALLLTPFTGNSLIKRVAETLLLPLGAFIYIGQYYTLVLAPFISIILVFGMSIITWMLLQYIKILPSVNIKIFIYTTIIIDSTVFIYYGHKITKMVLKLANNQLDYDRLINLLKPILFRLYVYGFITISYILSNIEKFSGKTILPWNVWINYKDVIIEISLTLALFESLSAIWREYKSRNILKE